MANATATVTDLCAAAKRAARVLATIDTATKDAALEAIAAALEDGTAEILESNRADLDGEQAAPALAQRARGAVVDDDRPAAGLRVAQPQLEARIAPAARGEHRPLLLAGERAGERAFANP